MRSIKSDSKMFFVAGLLLTFFVFFPPSVSGQTYPDKPITIYCSMAAGASTDLTARVMAKGAEKVLGVPVIVENKLGGGGTVAAALVASKKPDGYTLCAINTSALTISPHLLKVSYAPLNDFSPIMQYTRYVHTVTVASELPIKTIDEFIAYAKAHPGLSYGSSGKYNTNHLNMELFAECKGLTFKHVPTKGGAEINNLLLGKHVDFIAGTGQHVIYVKQGLFRQLLMLGTGKRNPTFPDVPTQTEIGCTAVPSSGVIVVGPKGIPKDISKKLDEIFKKITEGDDFQKVLYNFNMPYEYLEGEKLEKDIPAEYKTYGAILKKLGVKKEG